MTEHVKNEISDGIMTLTLQRPEKKNALTGAMYNALSEALKQAEADGSVRVVLFQGDGDSFTAGNDLADFASQARGESAVDSPAHRFIETISKVGKPLVAAVQGNAVGVGTTMLLHCDLVYLRGAAIAALELLRVNLRASAKYQDFLAAASDVQEAVVVDKSEVAGAEPAIGRERCLIRFRIIHISRGDRGATQLNLSDPAVVRVRDPDLSARQRPAGAADAARLRGIAGK